MQPDPEFPTVKYPNPEEVQFCLFRNNLSHILQGKGALKLSMATADAHGSRHILANDPDADRLAVAEKQADGSWRVFNGNEIGGLFASWVWQCHREKHPEIDPATCYMIATNVSSRLLAAMAEVEGFKVCGFM